MSIMPEFEIEEKEPQSVTVVEKRKELYDYQQTDIDGIFNRLENAKPNFHLLYQLLTGGGKTVIFSEIVRRYLKNNDKKRYL